MVGAGGRDGLSPEQDFHFILDGEAFLISRDTCKTVFFFSHGLFPDSDLKSRTKRGQSCLKKPFSF